MTHVYVITEEGYEYCHVYAVSSTLDTAKTLGTTLVLRDYPNTTCVWKKRRGRPYWYADLSYNSPSYFIEKLQLDYLKSREEL